MSRAISLICVTVAVATSILVVARVHGVVVSDFTNGPEDWHTEDVLNIDRGVTQWSGTVGNPGGCIFDWDYQNIDGWAPGYLRAPAKFLGDHSNMYGGYLQYDFRCERPDMSSGQDVILEGNGIRLTWDATYTNTAWCTNHVGLYAGAGWSTSTGPATESSIRAVLSNITALRIMYDYADYWVPYKSGFLDNVIMAPEPATLSLLALGGLLIARRRRA
jgi:hypothetical protein